MTELAPAPAGTRSAPDASRRVQVVAVADNVASLARSVRRTRARLIAAAAHNVEWSAHIVLKYVQNEGAVRSGAIAEYLQSDPSTISRQVATLVRDGLLERRADPHDGRASLLVVTDRARAVLVDHERIRVDLFSQMLSDWSPDDLETFAHLLARFGESYENTDHRWIADRFGAASVDTRSAD